MATLTTTIRYSEPAGSIITALGTPGPAGPGVPAGGLAGQILAKIDGVSYNTEWVTPQDDSAIWGQITGNLADQGDLQSALDSKLDVSTAASTYLPLSGGIITGNVLSYNNSGFYLGDSSIGPATYCNVAPHSISISSNISGTALTIESNGITFPGTGISKQTEAYPGLVILDGYATESWVTTELGSYLTISSAASTYYLQTNPAGFIDSSALAPYLLSSTAASTYAITSRGLPAGGNTSQVLTKSDNTDYSSTWTTIIPGDRYLTSSVTSNTVSNGAKTFAVQTGLSYTPTQDVTISYDANNHMHAVVTSYNSGTGTLVVDVRSHTGSGTYTSWVINVGGTVPLTTVSWGSITGVISAQTDLQGELDAKLNTTTAASTYFTISSAAGKANLAGSTFTGKVNLATISAANPSVNLGGQCDPAPASAVNGDLWISNAAAPKITYKIGGVNYNVPVLNLFNTFTASNVFDTTASTAAVRITQRGTGNAIEVEDSTTPDATRFAVDQFGKVGIGVAPDATAALKVDTNGIMFGDGTTQTTASPVTSVAGRTGAITLANTDISGLGTMSTATASDYSTTVVADGLYYPLSSNPAAYLTDAPSDGSTYGRNNGVWTVASGGGFVPGTSDLDLGAYALNVGYPTLSSVLTQTALTITSGAETSGNTFRQSTVSVNGHGTGFSSFGTDEFGNPYTELQKNNGFGADSITGAYNDYVNSVFKSFSLSALNGLSFVGGSGITFSDSTVQTTAAVPGIPEAPIDGNYYVRKDGAWYPCTVVSIYDVTTSQSYNCLTV